MTGQIKRMVDCIIQQASKGNPVLASTTRTKLILKGVDVKKFTALSADDPVIIEKLRIIAAEMNIR